MQEEEYKLIAQDFMLDVHELDEDGHELSCVDFQVWVCLSFLFFVCAGLRDEHVKIKFMILQAVATSYNTEQTRQGQLLPSWMLEASAPITQADARAKCPFAFAEDLGTSNIVCVTLCVCVCDDDDDDSDLLFFFRNQTELISCVCVCVCVCVCTWGIESSMRDESIGVKSIGKESRRRRVV